MPQLIQLIYDVFYVDLATYYRLGYWSAESRNFVFLNDSRCVANVTVLPMHLCIDGESHRAAAIQSVATHPRWRNRGLFRRLMEAALRWCDARYQNLFLFTDSPRLYEPFGFRTHHVSIFHKTLGTKQRRASSRMFRSGDEDWLLKLLAERTPSSKRFGFFDHRAMFMLHSIGSGFSQLRVFPELDCVVVATQQGAKLRIDDIVARVMPRFDELLSAFSHERQQVEFGFSPEQLGINADEKHANSDTQLMVRGPLDAHHIVAIPNCARF